MIDLFYSALTSVAVSDAEIIEAANSAGNMDPAVLMIRTRDTLLDFLPRLCGALIFVVISLAALRVAQGLVDKLLKRSKIDATLHSFILGLIKNSARVLIAIAALLILNFPASPLITLIGSVGLALSLALKDSLANMAGGISILFSHPFLKGDFIETKGVSGTVMSIDLVYTIIESESGDTIYLPNGDVAKSIVTNHKTKPEKSREDEDA